MKAIITAAGMGTRLGSITNDINKCLLPIGGTPILLHLIQALKSKGISEIFVITGYRTGLVEQAVQGLATCIYNKDYATTGLLSSVILAKEHIQGSEFVLMTGDTLMHPEIMDSVVKNCDQILASVELKECDEEDFKAIIHNHKILSMSKEIPLHQANAEFTAFVKIPAKASNQFFSEIEQFIQGGSQKKYIADIVLFLQNKGHTLTPVYTNGLPRIEIDFPEDLAKAHELYKYFPQTLSKTQIFNVDSDT